MFESLDSVLLPEHLDHFGFYVPSQSNHQSNHQTVSEDEYWTDHTDGSKESGSGLAPARKTLEREASVWVYGHEVADELAVMKV